MNPQSAQDLINMGFYGYQGWSDNAAIQDFRATGGQGKGSQTPSLSTGQPSGVQTASSGNPTQTGIQAAQGVISDIKSRYDQLKKEITGQAGEDVAKEFGARGVPISSGIVGQAQGRESARRSSDLLAQESGALAPFYQMLIGAQNQQAQNTSGGQPGLDDLWSSTINLNSAVTNPAAAQRTNISQQPVKLNLANKPTVTQQYQTSPLSNTQMGIYSALAPVQTALNKTGSFLSNIFKLPNKA